jgi:hypothetical protein
MVIDIYKLKYLDFLTWRRRHGMWSKFNWSGNKAILKIIIPNIKIHCILYQFIPYGLDFMGLKVVQNH